MTRYYCLLQQLLWLLLFAGILVEGFCSFIASMVGTGTGLSSFRDNIGALTITKVENIPFCFSDF